LGKVGKRRREGKKKKERKKKRGKKEKEKKKRGERMRNGVEIQKGARGRSPEGECAVPGRSSPRAVGCSPSPRSAKKYGERAVLTRWLWNCLQLYT
jgi:hypothetical protein